MLPFVEIRSQIATYQAGRVRTVAHAQNPRRYFSCQVSKDKVDMHSTKATDLTEGRAMYRATANTANYTDAVAVVMTQLCQRCSQEGLTRLLMIVHSRPDLQAPTHTRVRTPQATRINFQGIAPLLVKIKGSTGDRNEVRICKQSCADFQCTRAATVDMSVLQQVHHSCKGRLLFSRWGYLSYSWVLNLRHKHVTRLGQGGEVSPGLRCEVRRMLVLRINPSAGL